MRIRGEVRPRVTGALVALIRVAACPLANAECGDGALEEGEQCDVADENVASLCSDDCRFACTTTLNDKVTDHTCQHVTAGPYAAMAAYATDNPNHPPAASQGHVFFTVTMAKNEDGDPVDSFVEMYSPYLETIVYLNESEPITLVDSDGETVPVIFDAPITTCASGLKRGLVYATAITETYRIIFPAEGPTQRSLVLENAGSDNSLDFSHDGDGDGFGESRYSVRTWCQEQELVQAGFVRNTEDCDDMRASVYPGAVELCDELDNDCDGSPEVSQDACEPVPEPDETSAPAGATASGSDTDSPPPADNAGKDDTSTGQSTDNSSATLDAGSSASTQAGELSMTGPDPAGETTATDERDETKETDARARDAGGEQQGSNDDASGSLSGAGGNGCGCTVVGNESGRSARGVGALIALVVLSCGVRRRV